MPENARENESTHFVRSSASIIARCFSRSARAASSPASASSSSSDVASGANAGFPPAPSSVPPPARAADASGIDALIAAFWTSCRRLLIFLITLTKSASACETGSCSSPYGCADDEPVSVLAAATGWRGRGWAGGRTYLDLLDRFALQAKREEDGTLHGAEARLLPKPLLEVELCDSGEEVHDDVIVELVVGVRLQPLEVEWRHEDRQLRRAELCRSGLARHIVTHI